MVVLGVALNIPKIHTTTGHFSPATACHRVVKRLTDS